MPQKLVLCIALFRQQAEDILHRLELDHIADDHISVVFPDKGCVKIPGVGPYIGAGPIIRALSEAVSDVSCDIVSGLIGLGIPKDKALRYQRKIEGGHFLLTVHAATCFEIERAKRIFSDLGGQDICIPGEGNSTEAAQFGGEAK